MTKIRIGLIGAGQRGKDIYGKYILQMILSEKK